MDAGAYVALLAIVISVAATAVITAQTERAEYLGRMPIPGKGSAMETFGMIGFADHVVSGAGARPGNDVDR